jgi:hypothetical protein
MPVVNLALTLNSPPGEDADALRTRILEGVPVSTARKIVDDYLRFERTGAERYKLYRAGKERLIPMDFGEIVGLGYPTTSLEKKRYLR